MLLIITDRHVSCEDVTQVENSGDYPSNPSSSQVVSPLMIIVFFFCMHIYKIRLVIKSIREKLKVAPIVEKMIESPTLVSCSGYKLRRPVKALIERRY